MKKCRKICKECPWKKDNQHSLKFRNYGDKMKSIGKDKQACHMVTNDVWGYNNQITDSNICIGSLNHNNNF